MVKMLECVAMAQSSHVRVRVFRAIGRYSDDIESVELFHALACNVASTTTSKALMDTNGSEARLGEWFDLFELVSNFLTYYCEEKRERIRREHTAKGFSKNVEELRYDADANVRREDLCETEKVTIFHALSRLDDADFRRIFHKMGKFKTDDVRAVISYFELLNKWDFERDGRVPSAQEIVDQLSNAKELRLLELSADTSEHEHDAVVRELLKLKPAVTDALTRRLNAAKLSAKQFFTAFSALAHFRYVQFAVEPENDEHEEKDPVALLMSEVSALQSSPIQLTLCTVDEAKGDLVHKWLTDFLPSERNKSIELINKTKAKISLFSRIFTMFDELHVQQRYLISERNFDVPDKDVEALKYLDNRLKFRILEE